MREGPIPSFCLLQFNLHGTQWPKSLLHITNLILLVCFVWLSINSISWRTLPVAHLDDLHVSWSDSFLCCVHRDWPPTAWLIWLHQLVLHRFCVVLLFLLLARWRKQLLTPPLVSFYYPLPCRWVYLLLFWWTSFLLPALFLMFSFNILFSIT